MPWTPAPPCSLLEVQVGGEVVLADGHLHLRLLISLHRREDAAEVGVRVGMEGGGGEGLGQQGAWERRRRGAGRGTLSRKASKRATRVKKRVWQPGRPHTHGRHRRVHKRHRPHMRRRVWQPDRRSVRQVQADAGRLKYGSRKTHLDKHEWKLEWVGGRQAHVLL